MFHNPQQFRENYQPQRVGFDQYTKNVYGPNAQSYYAAPFPMQRSEFDKNVLNRYCTNCGGTDFCVGSVPTMNPNVFVMPTNAPAVKQSGENIPFY